MSSSRTGLYVGQLDSMSATTAEELLRKHPRLQHLQAKCAAPSPVTCRDQVDTEPAPFSMGQLNSLQLAAVQL